MNLIGIFLGFWFVSLGILFWFGTTSFPKGSSDVPGPAYWPRLIAWFLISLGGLFSAKSLFAKGDRSLFQSSQGYGTVFALLLFTLLYLLAWSSIGFFISTFLFLLASMFLFHRKQPVRLLLYSLSITLLVYAGFYWGMHVPLD